MTYRYSALSDSRIRLLALLPGRRDDALCGEIFETNFTSDLDIDPSYEALSYVWGSQASSRLFYIIQPEAGFSSTINLGPNLHSLLQHIRLEQSRRILWCDLISIDQANVEERAREITRMADIYRKARRVIIWLGPEAEDSALAMKAIEYTGSQVQIQPKLRSWLPLKNADPRFAYHTQEIPLSQQELQAIQKLITRNWFKRLWVRQEVTLARSSTVVVGHHEVPWTHLISTAAFLDTIVRLRGSADTAFGRDLFNLGEFGFMESYEDIMDILHACRACDCTEDHDRVYAVLGLLSSQRALSIKPDYSKGAKHVYQDLVMQYYQRHQRLNILTLCEAAKSPSWVPDLQRLRLDTGLHTRVANYCWASGEAAASLVLAEDNSIETYGVRCGVLDKSISCYLDKNSEPKILKEAIVKILKNDMGNDVSEWDEDRLEIMTKGLLGCIWFERTGRKNHCSLRFAISELRNWALEGSNGIPDHPSNTQHSLVLINHVARVLFHGDSCRWTQDGHLGLGHNACQEGDFLYAILGCRRLMALRREPESQRYRIVGKFDHPAYDDGEAFLGKLAPCWEVNYRHLLMASNRPRFVHENGTMQWQEPRLQDVALPKDWHEDQDQDGFPYWFNSDLSNERSHSDPRLTPRELKRRGIKIEKLVII